MSDFRKGDKVRVTFEGEYDRRDTAGGHVVWHDGGKHYTSSDATVEVIEPADDPSKDLVGTVRKDANSELIVVRAAVSSGEYPWAAITDTISRTHDEVFGWPVIGVVPDTPAAGAHEPKVRYFKHLGDNATWRWNSETLGIHVNFGWEASVYKTLAELHSAESVKEVAEP